VAINADLCMLPLLHIEDQMILLHIGKHNLVRCFKSYLLGSLLLVTMHVCSEMLLAQFSGLEKMN